MTVVCLCGRTERHLPTADCYVVVFQDDTRIAASETAEEVEQDD